MGQKNSYCAKENEICNVPEGNPRVIMYGANNKYYYRKVEPGSKIRCDDKTFGNPIINVNKECNLRYIPEYTLNNGIPENYDKCATEGGSCTLTYPANILYGSNGKYSYGFVQANQKIDCNNDVFTDPNLGIEKNCYSQKINPDFENCVQIPQVPKIFESSNYKFLTTGGGTGTMQPNKKYNVIYGADGKYITNDIIDTSSLSCNSVTFGGIDPAPGIEKNCYYKEI